MKKLLGILAAVGLTASSSTLVVCFRTSKKVNEAKNIKNFDFNWKQEYIPEEGAKINKNLKYVTSSNDGNAQIYKNEKNFFYFNEINKEWIDLGIINEVNTKKDSVIIKSGDRYFWYFLDSRGEESKTGYYNNENNNLHMLPLPKNSADKTNVWWGIIKDYNSTNGEVVESISNLDNKLYFIYKFNYKKELKTWGLYEQIINNPYEGFKFWEQSNKRKIIEFWSDESKVKDTIARNASISKNVSASGLISLNYNIEYGDKYIKPGNNDPGAYSKAIELIIDVNSNKIINEESFIYGEWRQGAKSLFNSIWNENNLFSINQLKNIIFQKKHMQNNKLISDFSNEIYNLNGISAYSLKNEMKINILKNGITSITSEYKDFGTKEFKDGYVTNEYNGILNYSKNGLVYTSLNYGTVFMIPTRTESYRSFNTSDLGKHTISADKSTITVDHETKFKVKNSKITKLELNGNTLNNLNGSWNVEIPVTELPASYELKFTYDGTFGPAYDTIIFQQNAYVEPEPEPNKTALDSLIKVTNIGNLPNNEDKRLKELIQAKNPAIEIQWNDIDIVDKTEKGATLVAKEDSWIYEGSIKITYNVVTPVVSDLNINMDSTSTQTTVRKDYLTQRNNTNTLNVVDQAYYANGEVEISAKKTPSNSEINMKVYGLDQNWKENGKSASYKLGQSFTTNGSVLDAYNGRYKIVLKDVLNNTNEIYLQVSNKQELPEFWSTENGLELKELATDNNYDWKTIPKSKFRLNELLQGVAKGWKKGLKRFNLNINKLDVKNINNVSSDEAENIKTSIMYETIKELSKFEVKATEKDVIFNMNELKEGDWEKPKFFTLKASDDSNILTGENKYKVETQDGLLKISEFNTILGKIIGNDDEAILDAFSKANANQNIDINQLTVLSKTNNSAIIESKQDSNKYKGQARVTFTYIDPKSLKVDLSKVALTFKPSNLTTKEQIVNDISKSIFEKTKNNLVLDQDIEVSINLSTITQEGIIEVKALDSSNLVYGETQYIIPKLAKINLNDIDLEAFDNDVTESDVLSLLNSKTGQNLTIGKDISITITKAEISQEGIIEVKALDSSNLVYGETIKKIKALNKINIEEMIKIFDLGVISKDDDQIILNTLNKLNENNLDTSQLKVNRNEDGTITVQALENGIYQGKVNIKYKVSITKQLTIILSVIFSSILLSVLTIVGIRYLRKNKIKAKKAIKFKNKNKEI